MKSQPIQPSCKAERPPFDSHEDGETLTTPIGKSTFGVTLDAMKESPPKTVYAWIGRSKGF